MKEKFCIAGWDTYERKMKRLLINRGYWDADQVPEYSSIMVNTEPLKEPHDYPHRSEDINTDFESIEVVEAFQPGQKLAAKLKERV